MLSTVPVSLVHPPDQPTHRHIQSTHHTRRCHSRRPRTQIIHRMLRLRPHQQPHLHQDSDKNMYRMVSCITDIGYQSYDCNVIHEEKPCRDSLVVSVSASNAVGREFASRPDHTKVHYKNGTNLLGMQALGY